MEKFEKFGFKFEDQGETLADDFGLSADRRKEITLTTTKAASNPDSNKSQDFLAVLAEIDPKDLQELVYCAYSMGYKHSAVD